MMSSYGTAWARPRRTAGSLNGARVLSIARNRPRVLVNVTTFQFLLRATWSYWIAVSWSV